LLILIPVVMEHQQQHIHLSRVCVYMAPFHPSFLSVYLWAFALSLLLSCVCVTFSSSPTRDLGVRILCCFVGPRHGRLDARPANVDQSSISYRCRSLSWICTWFFFFVFFFSFLRVHVLLVSTLSAFLYSCCVLRCRHH
jgi:hypothetical protein